MNKEDLRTVAVVIDLWDSEQMTDEDACKILMKLV